MSLTAQSPRFGEAISAVTSAPRVPSDLVVRPGLTARLQRGLDRKLTLIAAPAGYGKTTLLASWLQDADPAAVYIALDETHAPPTAFLAASVVAIQSVVPEFGRALRVIPMLSELSRVTDLAATFAAEAAQLPRPIVLVLDDYHLLNSADVDELLSRLIDRLPPSLRIVIATREEPALPTARLRARGELFELRAEDLRFDRETARAFLEQRGPTAPELVDALFERTEGWPAGLRLAALAIEAASTPALADGQVDGRVESAGTPGEQFAHDFLIEDVFAAQDVDTQRFLLATSALDSFCGPLADAVLETPNGIAHAMLSRLVKRNVFTIGLADDGWFRYHTLFRDALRERLLHTCGTDAIVTVHERASAWHAAHGRISTAVTEQLAAGNEEVAAGIVESRLQSALAHEQWPQLEEWLRLLPGALIQSRPALLIARAWLHYVHYQLPAIPRVLDAAGALHSAADGDAVEPMRCEIATLRAALLLEDGASNDAFESAWSAFERLPAEYAYARGIAAGVAALAATALGESANAAARLEASLLRTPDSGSPGNTRVRGALSFLYLATHDLHRAKDLAEIVRQEASEQGLDLTEAWAHYLLGRVRYEWNEPKLAEQHFAAVYAARGKCHLLLLRNAMHGLALAQQAQGASDAAIGTAAEIRAIMGHFHDEDQIGVERAFEARLALLRGDAEVVARWIEAVHVDQRALAHVLAVEEPRVTLVQALLTQDREAPAREAAAEASELLGQSETRHDGLRLVVILALQALARQALGDAAGALEALDRSFRLAEPAGRVRVYVDLGAPMGRLIALYAARRGASAYVKQLVRACGATPPASRVDQVDRELVEALTRREQQVLRLLAARRTNGEIARELCVSPSTAKKHAMNIYQKLNVSGRRHAVAQAYALGLLTPTPVHDGLAANMSPAKAFSPIDSAHR